MTVTVKDALKQYFGSDTEVRETLALHSQSTPSNWRAANQFPSGHAVRLFIKLQRQAGFTGEFPIPLSLWGIEDE